MSEDKAVEQLSPLPKGENFRRLRDNVRSHLDQAKQILGKHRLSSKLSESELKLTELSVAAGLARESGKNDIDEKTGIFTKPALLKRLEEESKLEERLAKQGKDYPSTLVFVDLNGLKEINDTLGHDAGDEHIRKLIGFLQGSMRSTDYLGKYGGDEFVALLRGTNSEEAQIWLAKVKEAMAQTELSASFGMHPFDTKDVGESIKLADQAMYTAKEQHYKETGKTRRTSS